VSWQMLWQVQVQRVDFVGTQIAHEERRAIGSESAPRSDVAEVSRQILGINYQLRVAFSEPDATKTGFTGRNPTVVNITPITRPCREVYGPGEELKRNKPPELGIFSFIDDSHPAAAKLAQDAVVRNGLIPHCAES